MDEIWVAVLAFVGSSAGGAVIAGCFGTIARREQKKIEHSQWERNKHRDEEIWRRDKKFAVYEDHLNFVALWRKRWNELGPAGGIDRNFLNEWLSAYSTFDLSLVAPTSTQQAVHDHGSKTQEWFSCVIDGGNEDQKKRAFNACDTSYGQMVATMRSDMGFEVTPVSYDDERPVETVVT